MYILYIICCLLRYFRTRRARRLTTRHNEIHLLMNVEFVVCLSIYGERERERERESLEMRERSDVDGGTTQCRWSAGKAESAEMAESIGIWRGGEENNRGEDVKEPLKTKQTASTAPTDPQFNCSSLPCLIWKRFVR